MRASHRPQGQQHASQCLLPVGIEVDVTTHPILSWQALRIEELLCEQRSLYPAPQVTLGQGTGAQPFSHGNGFGKHTGACLVLKQPQPLTSHEGSAVKHFV